MAITIRKALSEDAADFARCRIKCMQSAYKGIMPDEYLQNLTAEEDKYVKRYEKDLSEPSTCEFFFAMHSEEIVGFLIVDTADCEIWAVYLTEAFWGKGYGKQLLDFAVERLAPVSKGEISLWVLAENLRARRFYEKHGFAFNGAKREMQYGTALIALKYVLDVGDE